MHIGLDTMRKWGRVSTLHFSFAWTRLGSLERGYNTSIIHNLSPTSLYLSLIMLSLHIFVLRGNGRWLQYNEYIQHSREHAKMVTFHVDTAWKRGTWLNNININVQQQQDVVVGDVVQFVLNLLSLPLLYPF